METKSIVILGNGFDVALGIPTRYKQFYDRSEDLRKYAQKGNSLCQHILSHYKSDSCMWSDLEEGLYKYSLDITQKHGENNAEQTRIFEIEFNELRSALFEYLESVAGTQVSMNEQAPVMGLNIEWSKLNPQYFTFNYSINTAVTASRNNQYDIFNFDDSINEKRFIYQHGSIFDTQTGKNHDPSEIVVGIDSQTQKVEKAHSFLYKEKQHLHNLEKTFDYYKKAQFYIIYGCSMGDSDAVYFRAIFNAEQRGKVFLIYGYGDAAINSIKSNIQRICRITIDQLSNNNQVEFLDVTKIQETRDKTRKLINSYISAVN